MDDQKMTHWGWKVASVLVLLTPLVVGVWLIAANPAEPSEDAARSDTAAGFAPFSTGDAGAARDASSTRNRAQPAKTRARNAVGERFAGRPVVRPDAAAFARPKDADSKASGGQKPTSDWNDPVRKKILGQKTWMAKLPAAQRQDIEEEIDRERPETYPLDLGLRRVAIESAREAVHGCFDRLLERDPAASGRLSVAFDLVADGQQARPYNVDIPALVELHDPDFERCVIERLERVSIPTTEEGVMGVEYPFLFDSPDPPAPEPLDP